jgi:rhodanese-related sulfurtransferase
VPRKLNAPQAQQASRKTDRIFLIIIVAVLVVVIGYGAVMMIRSTSIQPPQATPTVQAIEINRIKVDEAKALLDSGQAILLDARSAESYASQHATGAISFPEAKELELLSQLPKDKILIFYCTWPAEQTSVRVARLAITKGFDANKVYALLGGLEAWITAGYPLEVK